jgi:hypothetical protein
MSDCPETWCEYFSHQVLTIKKNCWTSPLLLKVIDYSAKVWQFSSKNKKISITPFFMLEVNRLIFFKSNFRKNKISYLNFFGIF